MNAQLAFAGTTATPPERQRRWRGPFYFRHLPTTFDRSPRRVWYPHELGDRVTVRLR